MMWKISTQQTFPEFVKWDVLLRYATTIFDPQYMWLLLYDCHYIRNSCTPVHTYYPVSLSEMWQQYIPQYVDTGPDLQLMTGENVTDVDHNGCWCQTDKIKNHTIN